MPDKVLLIMPKIGMGSFDFGIPNEPPVGLAYIAAMLKRHSVAFKVIDMRLGYSFDAVKEIVAVYKPTVIGVSYWSLERSKTQALIKAVKAVAGVPIVIGGPHVSSVRKESLEETDAEYAVKGEGEFTIIELLGFLRGDNIKLEDINGLIFKKGGDIFENPDREPNKNLDDLPFPAYEDFETARYVRKNRINIATSRGCPYGCNYCAVRLTMGRNFRPRSPQNVVDELAHWNRMGYGEFQFVDDCFTFDMARAGDICDLVIKRGLKIDWFLDNGIRVDRVSEPLLKKMKASGCKIVMFGVESGDDGILARMGKGIKIRQAEESVRMAKNAGIEYVGATFIIGHPGENLKMIREYMKKIRKWPADKINFYNLVPYPGTEVFEWVKKNAVMLDVKDSYLDHLSYYSGIPIFETKDFPAKDRVKALKMGKRLTKSITSKYYTKVFTKKYGPVIGFLGGKLVNFKRLMVILSSLGVSRLIKKI